MKKTGPSASPPRRRVYIVDDHPLIRDSLAQLIRAEPDLTVCGESGDYRSAVAGLERVKPDAAIVDIGLQGVSGIEVIREAKFRTPQTQILVLSMFDEQSYATQCLKTGARGYIMKSEPPNKVLEALRIILAGDIYLSPAVTHRVLKQAISATGAGPIPIAEQLSHRELEVFRMLGHGLTTVEIASGLSLSRKTVQTYREHIKEKLDIPHATELMRRAAQWVREEEFPGSAGPKPNDEG